MSTNGAAAAPILRDPKQLVRVVPPDQEGRPEGEQIAYHLKVPRALDKPAFTREIAALGGRMHSEFELMNCLIDGVKAALPEGDSQIEELVGIITDYRDRYLEAGKALTLARDSSEEEIKAVMAEHEGALRRTEDVKTVFDALAGNYPPLDRMLGDNDAYGQYEALAAARLFLMDWEGFDEPFKRTLRGISDDLLDRIPSMHLAVIAGKIREMIILGASREKNSRSPFTGSSSRKRSRTAKSSRPKTPPKAETAGA